jgi:trans-aconitate 2-methyltransferase
VTGGRGAAGAAPWEPARYARYAAQRLRPGLDLIARLPETAPQRVVDLGCGTGDLTAALADRFPGARVTGVDASPAMLAEARAVYPALAWLDGDIAGWAPDAPVDLIFTNAALHWLGDHARLLPRLLDALAPGGVFACQMPRNFAAPSHTLLRAVADRPRWAGRIALLDDPVAAPAVYWDLLAPLTVDLDIWQTEYLQALSGADPVFDWVRATTLRPVLQALEGAELDAFLADYRACLAEAYPRRPDGTTLYPFNRLFIVARVG